MTMRSTIRNVAATTGHRPCPHVHWDIQAAANSGLVVLLDTGAVFIGTVGPSS
jgi:hypothetical protein